MCVRLDIKYINNIPNNPIVIKNFIRKEYSVAKNAK